MVEICRDLEILSAQAREANRADSRIARRLESALKQYNEEVEAGVQSGPYCAGMAADMIGEDAAIICVTLEDRISADHDESCPGQRHQRN